VGIPTGFPKSMPRARRTGENRAGWFLADGSKLAQEPFLNSLFASAVSGTGQVYGFRNGDGRCTGGVAASVRFGFSEGQVLTASWWCRPERAIRTLPHAADWSAGGGRDQARGPWALDRGAPCEGHSLERTWRIGAPDPRGPTPQGGRHSPLRCWPTSICHTLDLLMEGREAYDGALYGGRLTLFPFGPGGRR